MPELTRKLEAAEAMLREAIRIWSSLVLQSRVWEVAEAIFFPGAGFVPIGTGANCTVPRQQNIQRVDSVPSSGQSNLLEEKGVKGVFARMSSKNGLFTLIAQRRVW
ncbi:hypothetical protein SAY87_025757 [Trapa incisa]|uniref:Uncharacterized protein n=1 Tax=Trapa incisa TaxID=236973 RepID=A0AAN7GIG4_9MYRT|nr:hypothetical protein SAY87_025757 [Trapa incisa]